MAAALELTPVTVCAFPALMTIDIHSFFVFALFLLGIFIRAVYHNHDIYIYNFHIVLKIPVLSLHFILPIHTSAPSV